MTISTTHSYFLKALQLVCLALVSVLALSANAATNLHINVGGGNVTDIAGKKWVADYGFQNGYRITVNNDVAIKNTNRDPIFRSQRRHNTKQTELSYVLPVSNGTYSVIFHFAELQTAAFAAGQRVFDVYVEGSKKKSGIDVFRQSGGAYTAMSRTVSNVSVNDGNLNLSLKGIKRVAMLSGIEVIAQGGSTATGGTNLKITSQPSNALATPGSTVSMSVGASGNGTLAYQWFFNGSKVSGATSSTLRLASVQTVNAGNYYCVVSIGSDSVTSSTAKLVVSGDDPVATQASVQISWIAPTTRVDGTTLNASDIAAYEIFHGAGSTSNMSLIETVDGATRSTIVDGLGLGKHYFTIKTVDKSGARSSQSTMVNITN